MTAVCPDCRGPTTWPWPATCPHCGIALGGPDADRLAQIDRDLNALWQERNDLILRLRKAGRPPERPPADGPAPRSRPVGRLRGMSAQVLLASAGVGLLVVAAIIFAAVTWDQLGAWTRVAILLTATAGAAVTARALTQRGFRATGEAVAVLTVALLLVDVHGAYAFGVFGLADVHPLLYVAIAYTVLVAVAHALQRWSGTRAPGLLAGVLAVVPGPAAVWYTNDVVAVTSEAVFAVGFLLASAATLAYARRLAIARLARAVATGGAGAMWLGAAIAAVAFTADRPVLGLALALAVAVAAGATVVFGHAWRVVGPLGASVALTVGTATAISAAGPPLRLAAPLVFAAAVALLSFARKTPARGGALGGTVPVGIVSAGSFLAAVAPLIEGAFRGIDLPWQGLTAPTLDWTAVAIIALFGAAVAAVLRLVNSESAGLAAAAVAAVVTLAAGFQAVPFGAMAQAALGLAVAAAAAWWATQQVRAEGVAIIAGAAAWALAWALAGRWMTVAALLAITAITAWTATSRDFPRSSRLAAVTIAAATGLALVPATFAAGGASAATAGLLAVAAAAALVAGVDYTVTRDPDTVFVPGEPVAALAALVGLLLSAASLPVLAVSFAVAGVGAGVHALRPDRRLAAVAAVLLLSASSWAALADRGVELVEAYTAVPALGALVLGWRWLVADPAARTLPALGPGLSLALVPTAVLVLSEPSDLVRVLVLAVAGTALALLGGRTQTAAPVVFGVGAIAIVVLTQLAVAASHLPRWVTFAALGIVLVAFSATYERQLQRLNRARERISFLR